MDRIQQHPLVVALYRTHREAVGCGGPCDERFYIGAGMLMYDIFSWTGGRPPGVPHHRHLTSPAGETRQKSWKPSPRPAPTCSA